MYIRAVVTPGAKKEQIEQLSSGRFLVAVREEAQRNEANKRVIELFARRFGVERSKVRVVSGHRSRIKLIAVE